MGMARSPSPSGMMGGPVEGGTSGYPEQSAPEQGTGLDGSLSVYGGSTGSLRIGESRARVAIDT
jgi:hypothetical protein